MRTSRLGGRALRVCGVLLQMHQAIRAGIARRLVRGTGRGPTLRRGLMLLVKSGQAGVARFCRRRVSKWDRKWDRFGYFDHPPESVGLGNRLKSRASIESWWRPRHESNVRPSP